MELILPWWQIVSQLSGAFSRQVTFYWAVLVIMGFCTRQDSLGGISSFIRCIGIKPEYYNRLDDFFHSNAVDLEKLTLLWVETVLKFFKPLLLTIKGNPILVLDGISNPKEGKKMPGVQQIYQSSDNNSKTRYAMGHLFQFVGILAGSPAMTIFCVFLFGRIHLGTKRCNRDKRTLFDKAVSMLDLFPADIPFYLVADSFYAARKMLRGLLKRNSHIITRVRSTAVAWESAGEKKTSKRGRPKKYKNKIKLKDLFSETDKFTKKESPVYGEKGVTILVRTVNLLSKSFFGMTLKYILVIHPTRGKIILLSSDLSLDPLEVIKTYGYRFKIELGFKSAIYSMGTFLYRFWMKDMDKTRRAQGCKHLHKKPEEYRKKYLSKLKVYELYVQLGFIAQSIRQYLSLTASQSVWSSFGSWIRTIRPNTLPSEMVVGKSLSNNLIYFLKGNCFPTNLTKFLRMKVDIQEIDSYKDTG